MKYEIILTSAFKMELKNIKKRNKDLSKLTEIVNKLANNEELDIKNRDHALINNLRFKNCRECHIEPDWLLVYRKGNDKLILFLTKKLVEFNDWCKENRTKQLDEIIATVRKKLTDYHNYYGITDNSITVEKFYNRSINILLKWLNRRSQRMSFTREEFKELLKEYKIPKPIVKVNIYELVKMQK